MRTSLLGAVVLAVLVVLAIEGLCWAQGWTATENGELRRGLYWGGAAGFLINLLSYPFMLILAALPPEKVRAGAQWNWWLYGVLARLAGVVGLMLALRGKFPGHERTVTLMAMAVYLVGMFAELAWIARRFNAMDTK